MKTETKDHTRVTAVHDELNHGPATQQPNQLIDERTRQRRNRYVLVFWWILGIATVIVYSWFAGVQNWPIRVKTPIGFIIGLLIGTYLRRKKRRLMLSTRK